MRRLFLGRIKKWTVGSALVLLLGLGALAWLERTRLTIWYCVHGLAAAGDADRNQWVERVAGLDAAALPALLDRLGQDDPQACANVQQALASLADRWGSDDPRVADLVGRLSAAFAALSTPGQQAALTVADRAVAAADRSTSLPAALVPSAVRLLEQAANLPDESVHAEALSLASTLADRVGQEQVVRACRALAAACLRDQDKDNRTHAVRLALHPKVWLLREVVPLLGDPAPEIRRAVMAAVGSKPEAIDTDDLLPWLHDPDAQVRGLCEEALRLRGLREAHLRLGRLKTDQDPKVRLQVVDYLPYSTDLDPGVWLRSLSHDPVPAVRAAAIRAAVEQGVVDLSDRIDQMAQNDPSPTIRQLAQHYIACQKSGQSPSSKPR